MNEQNQGHWEEVQPDSDLWNWDVQPILEGVLVNMEERTKRDGTTLMAYTIERDGEHEDGNQVTTLGSKILDTRLKKCELGTRIKITFLGKELSGNGFEYRNFRVHKRKDDGTATPPQPHRDPRTHDRIAAERGEINRPSDAALDRVSPPLDLSAGLPEDKEEINVNDLPF